MVAGAAGRMGRTVVAAIEAEDDLELRARVDPALRAGNGCYPTVGDALGDGGAAPDVMVDFTRPEAVLANVRTAVEAGVHAVVGTTGIDDEVLAELAKLTGAGPANVLVVPNFAVGAVLMMRFAAEAARHLPETEIVELHHDRKLDAPSGTAKRTADLVRQAGGNVHEPIHSVRLPGLVAHQEVILGGEGQTLTIRHDSIDRHSFMPGVLLAARRVGELPDRFTVGLEHLL